MAPAQPELKKVRSSRLAAQYGMLTGIQYLDKRLFVQLNGSRKVIGVLRGYDVRASFPSGSQWCPSGS